MQLLFDPCVFLCALVIVFLLVVGSKRSVEAEVSIGASLEHLSRRAACDLCAVPLTRRCAEREKLSPARMLLFLCPLVMGSGVLVLFFFFPGTNRARGGVLFGVSTHASLFAAAEKAYMYFVFLLIITVAALTSTSTVIGEFVQFLLK